MAKRGETEVQEIDVQKEHLDGVRIGAHWAYLLGVLIGSTMLMVGLIALLGSGA